MAPLAIMATVLPAQSVGLFTITVGVVFTDTEATAVFEEIHPLAVPVTE